MNSQDRILSYIFRFACEEKLPDLQEFMADKYPIVLENHGLTIPSQGLYKAIDNFETIREEGATKQVRALYQYYQDILDVPQVDNIPFCPLPEDLSKRSYDNVNTDPFPFVSNILSCVSHPSLPNLLITSSATRDLVVSYFPTPHKDDISAQTKLIQNNDVEFEDRLKPIVLARSVDVCGPILSIETVLIKVNDDAFNLILFTGHIDGSLSIFKLATISSNYFTPKASLPNPPSFTPDMLSLELTKMTTLRPHHKYLTRIQALEHILHVLPSHSTFRIITGSHDESIAIIDVSIDSLECNTITCDVVKNITFKGKVESFVLLPTPVVFSQQTHPVLQYPELIPSKETLSSYRTSVVRKINKGSYLDSVDFISPTIPFTQPVSQDINSSTLIPSLIAISVRNDAYIHIFDVNTFEEVDVLNANITGDDHVSFTTLEMIYDSHYGLLYLATDNQLILIIDVLTKQHVRRLYCTENSDMSNPILRFLPIPQIFTNLTTDGDLNEINGNELCEADEMMKNKVYMSSYVNLIAITTSYNTIKVYNQHSQEQLREYQANKKNIKGFVLLPSTQPQLPSTPDTTTALTANTSMQPYGFITTGFDKSFSVYY